MSWPSNERSWPRHEHGSLFSSLLGCVVRAILTYHSIDESGSVISLPEPVFRRHADWLGSGAVRVTGVEELLTLDPQENAVAITFDDGFENFGSTAWPILQDHGLTATVFVVADHVGRTNTWGGETDAAIPELPLLDWDRLAGLADEGVELGSHTRRHPRLTALDAERLEDEIAGSAEAIERNTGVHPAGFAYPYGALDRTSREAVQDTYAWACTTELMWLPAGVRPHLLPRLDSYYYREASLIERWGSNAFRRHLRLRGSAPRLRERVTRWGSLRE
jgi:peptidoglycan/xylan/chitin deacetylase (PgdA/CDA1 family)